MTLTQTVIPRIDGRDYKQLPAGVSRWVATTPTITGTTSGATTFNINFNPDSNPDFQKYVVVSSLSLDVGGVALAILAALVRIPVNQWEDYVAVTSVVEVFPLLNYYNTASHAGQLRYGPYLLGRAVGGTTASLSVLLEEKLNTTYGLAASGLISDRPFIAPEFLRA